MWYVRNQILYLWIVRLEIQSYHVQYNNKIIKLGFKIGRGVS